CQLVFISSLSHFVGYPGAATYAASKDGLHAYASSLSASTRSLRVLTVYPGPTRTAHARRYSPDNTRETRRMPPDRLALAILGAVQQRRRTLIPGAANRMFALLGVSARGLTNILMRRALFDKL
ncbi:MAG: SDR family NAD(P)-dependent oxidoreductase, partial [Gemmatimonadota bacterium]|nr:SDR family NAD(P)-dependent oxidoreductase [Gemmatimonadota bacterium]